MTPSLPDTMLNIQVPRASVSDGLGLGVCYLTVPPTKVVCTWGWRLHNSPKQT